MKISMSMLRPIYLALLASLVSEAILFQWSKAFIQQVELLWVYQALLILMLCCIIFLWEKLSSIRLWIIAICGAGVGFLAGPICFMIAGLALASARPNVLNAINHEGLGAVLLVYMVGMAICGSWLTGAVFFAVWGLAKKKLGLDDNP